jgi:hypothetical protein
MLLAYRAQAPMVDQLLKESGFVGNDPVSSLIGAASGLTTEASGGLSEERKDI